MTKYEIYQKGKIPPLAIIEADGWQIDYDKRRLALIKDNDYVAVFNFDNIAGLRKVEE